MDENNCIKWDHPTSVGGGNGGGGRPSKVVEVMAIDRSGFYALAGAGGTLNGCARALVVWLEKSGVEISIATAKRAIYAMIAAGEIEVKVGAIKGRAWKLTPARYGNSRNAKPADPSSTAPPGS